MSDILNKTIVLVLNRNWQAINIRTPQDAFCQMATNVATGLDIEGENHIRPATWEEWITLPIREGDHAVLTSRKAIRVPTVIVVAVAGSNGAGRSTFFEAHLKSCGLRFLNADAMARELQVEAYEAARMIAALRTELVSLRESFVFETVFSDPVGDKMGFLKRTAQSGYAVVLCFVGIADTDTSEQRVAMRVSQGGHYVPTDKLIGRFPRTLANLAAAIRELPCVLVFDNDDLRTPFRHVAAYMNGKPVRWSEPIPSWFKRLL